MDVGVMEPLKLSIAYKDLTLNPDGRLEIEAGYDEFMYWQFTPEQLRTLRDWLNANVKD